MISMNAEYWQSHSQIGILKIHLPKHRPDDTSHHGGLYIRFGEIPAVLDNAKGDVFVVQAVLRQKTVQSDKRLLRRRGLVKEIAAQENEIHIELACRFQHLFKVAKRIVADDGVLLGVALIESIDRNVSIDRNDARGDCRSRSGCAEEWCPSGRRDN